jgi:hypothetical protein
MATHRQVLAAARGGPGRPLSSSSSPASASNTNIETSGTFGKGDMTSYLPSAVGRRKEADSRQRHGTRVGRIAG